MKDIRLKNTFLKVQYIISWISFILFGFLILWVIALGLATYGKNTELNKPKKKWLLNKSYQKLIFWYGSVVGDIVIVGIIINLIFSIIL
jgi:uncharacterized membrane protein